MPILSWASVLLVSILAVVGCAGTYQGMGPDEQGYGGNYSRLWGLEQYAQSLTYEQGYGGASYQPYYDQVYGDTYYEPPPQKWAKGEKKGWRGAPLPPGQMKKLEQGGSLPPGQMKKFY
jgi:hypothetical protein